MSIQMTCLDVGVQTMEIPIVNPTIKKESNINAQRRHNTECKPRKCTIREIHTIMKPYRHPQSHEHIS